MKTYNTIVIGGGASGMFLASQLTSNYLLIEASSACGKKLAISGGGKCNFTNYKLSNNNFTGNQKLIDAALNRLSTKQMCKIIDSFRLAYETKKETQLFLKTSAKALVDALKLKIKNITYDTIVDEVIFENGKFFVYSNNKVFCTHNVVVATGGISYGTLGASDIGYKIGQSFGHKIVTPKPALVGFTLQSNDFWLKELSGVSLNVEILVNNKKLQGDMLFAHKGITGPVVLNASLYYEKGFLEIDFLPNFDFKNLKGQKQISTVLPLPKSFTKSFLEKICLQDIACNKLTEQDIEKLLELKHYKLAPAGTFGYSKAEITKGGVCGSEINSDSFESNLQSGLYFIGEVLDVNGELGGYNIHFAFASALVCGTQINKSTN